MTKPAAAKHWFERRDAGDGVTLIFEPYVDPFLRANIWHVRGHERDLLVDSGLGVSSLRAFAPDLFDRDVIAVATHAHYDHTGGLYEFDNIAAHPNDAERLRRPGRASLLVSDFPQEYRAELEVTGNELITAYPTPDFEPAAYAVQPADVTLFVNEGDVIDLGGRSFGVLHLPGHTPGSIGLWDAGSGVLFPGDVIYDGELLDDLRESDVDHYVASMRRLRELPVRVVHAGHYDSFGRERHVALVDRYLAKRG